MALPGAERRKRGDGVAHRPPRLTRARPHGGRTGVAVGGSEPRRRLAVASRNDDCALAVLRDPVVGRVHQVLGDGVVQPAEAGEERVVVRAPVFGAADAGYVLEDGKPRSELDDNSRYRRTSRLRWSRAPFAFRNRVNPWHGGQPTYLGFQVAF